MTKLEYQVTYHCLKFQLIVTSRQSEWKLLLRQCLERILYDVNRASSVSVWHNSPYNLLAAQHYLIESTGRSIVQNMHSHSLLIVDLQSISAGLPENAAQGKTAQKRLWMDLVSAKYFPCQVDPALIPLLQVAKVVSVDCCSHLSISHTSPDAFSVSLSSLNKYLHWKMAKCFFFFFC